MSRPGSAARAWRAAATALAALVIGCAPTIPDNPAPAAMQWDPGPPRVPSPNGLIVNPATKRIDFSLANITVPADCTAQQSPPEAECEFDQYLETLDGYPTVTPAEAPASAALDPSTLTLGANVVALAADGSAVPDVDVGFDGAGDFVTVSPNPSWSLGQTYWFAIRGYDNGVRTAAGQPVVGSPTDFLLKQDAPLTCGVSDPSELDRSCPGFDLLLSQGLSPTDAASTLQMLEQARLSYAAAGAWDLVAAAGIPKAEVAVLWGFPVHTSSVVELAPPTIVPVVAAANEIRVAVHGSVDPTTVTPFVAKQQAGSVVVMDLDAVATMDLVGGLPAVDAQVSNGAIVITGAAPFVAGHTIGLFFTDAIRDSGGGPLVASPVSVLLTLRGALVGADGHSTVTGVADADAGALELGREQLAALFDNQALTSLTGINRDNLIYCYAFTFSSGASP